MSIISQQDLLHHCHMTRNSQAQDLSDLHCAKHINSPLMLGGPDLAISSALQGCMRIDCKHLIAAYDPTLGLIGFVHVLSAEGKISWEVAVPLHREHLQ